MVDGGEAVAVGGETWAWVWDGGWACGGGPWVVDEGASVVGGGRA